MTVTIAVFGAAIGTALTTTFTAAGSVVPREAHGVGFGFLSSASLIGSAISPMLSGLVAARSIQVVFLSGAAILALIVADGDASHGREGSGDRDAFRRWTSRALLRLFLMFAASPWPLRLVLVDAAGLSW